VDVFGEHYYTHPVSDMFFLMSTMKHNNHTL